jgi:hypothetical protein
VQDRFLDAGWKFAEKSLEFFYDVKKDRLIHSDLEFAVFTLPSLL